MGRLHLSTLFMTLIANGNHSRVSVVLPSTTIPIRRSFFDIISHGKDLETSLLYMECQLPICLSYCLSLSLKKSHIFPQQFEFLGTMYVQKGTSLLSLSMTCFRHGQNLRSSEMLLSSLGLPSSIASTFTTSNFVSCPFEPLPSSGNTLSPLTAFGPTVVKALLMMSVML
jgi:hypothetical protein